MIICVCNNVSEKEIRELHYLSLEDIMFKTSAAMCCGSCFEALQKIVEEQNENVPLR
jgi:bacterioferritin-associated ferredoxin